MLDKTLAIVLAGGRGSRLKPLTDERAKPAVPFGGKYRIIDFTLANCLHSGVRQILVLTQYKSHSLQKHLRDGWNIFNPELKEYITPVPPQMRAEESWYTGTANAIYQNRYLLERSDAEFVLVLSGDHIYRMDYAAMLDFHRKHGGPATIACIEMDANEASAYGVLSIDSEGRITDFIEKPGHAGALTDNPGHALVSMGIYIFSMEMLVNCLNEDQRKKETTHDFGKDFLPQLIHEHPVYAYRFGGFEGRVTVDKYWRDVGTLDSFYEANMDLLKPIPPIDLYQDDWPIRTYPGQHPPARTVPGASGTEGICINSIGASGVVIAGGSVQESILFPRVFLDDESMVERALLFEGVRVGERARLKNCIVDKNVIVPAGEQVGYEPDKDRHRFTVSEKDTVIIPKGYRFT